MFAFSIAILFGIIYCDAFLLEDHKKVLYQKTLKIGHLRWAIFSTLFLFIVLPFVLSNQGSRLADTSLGVIAIIVFVAIQSIYLIRRSQYVKQEWPTLRLASLETSMQKRIFLSDVLGIMLTWIYGMVIVVIVMKFFLKLFPPLRGELGEVIFVSTFSFFLTLFLIYRATQKYQDQSFFDFVGLLKGKQSFLIVATTATFFGLLFASFSTSIILNRQTHPNTPLNEIIGSNPNPILIGVFIVVAIMIAPLCEEMVFRGYLFKVIKKLKGQRWAIYIISLLFGLLHVNQYWGDWLAIGMVTILGFVLTLMRVWSGTTIASAITHYAYNGGVVIIPIIYLLFTNPAYVEYQILYPQLDVAQKIELLQQSVETQPDLSDAYNDLAWIYAKEGKDLSKALEFIEKALSFDPKSENYLDTKAEILYKLGYVNEALGIAKDLTHRKKKNKHYRKQLKKFQQAADLFSTEK